MFTVQAAHSDNIKQVRFLPNNNEFVLSASQDKDLKLWAVNDKSAELVSTVRLNEAIETFSYVMFNDMLYLLVANGSFISIVQVSDDNDNLQIVANIHAFQKPVLKVSYDSVRQRVIASGLDQQIKFFEIFTDED